MNKFLYIFVILLGIQLAPAKADGVFKIKSDLRKYLLPHKVEVQATIEDHLTLTKTKQSFKNTESNSVEVQYGFPVPANARVVGFKWWIDSKEYNSVLIERKQDTAVANVTGSADEAFISYTGQNPFLINIIKPLQPNSEIIVELSYIELLDNFKGTVEYKYPMGVFLKEKFEFDLSMNVTSRWGIDTIASEFFEGAFLKQDSVAIGTIHIDSVSQSRNIIIRYSTLKNKYGLSLLSAKNVDDDGFYLMQVRPQPMQQQNDSLKRSVLFVMDVSESMRGGKFKFEKEAISYCLDHLSLTDKFNIIEFNETAPVGFKSGFSEVNAQTLAEAKQYLNTRVIGGKTNITNALISALDQNYPEGAVKMLIVFSDGHDNINLSSIASKNLLKKVAIYTIATGSDADQNVLKELSKQNYGATESITNNNREVGIQDFFGKIQNPLLIKPEISSIPVETYERFPVKQPDVYAGEQLIQIGRYKDGGASDIVLKGGSFSGAVEYSFKGNFSADSVSNSLVSKLWAKYKIDELVDLILKNPADSNRVREWRKEIVSMSLRYVITSPYTSFRDQGIDDTTKIEKDTTGSGGGTSDVLNTYPEVASEIFVYPNPTIEAAVISFIAADIDQDYTIEIFSAAGELVQKLYQGKLAGGKNYFYWNGLDREKISVSSGVYICRISSKNGSRSVKIFINR